MTHRSAKLLLALVLLGFFGPPLLRGEVIFAHDNGVEMGLAPTPETAGGSSRKLSDQSSIYLPTLQIQLRGNGSGWLSTWNPHAELGRPTTQVSGFSKAFVLTHIFSLFSTDPFTVYTWLAIAAVVLSASFAYGLLRALALHPAACLAGSLWLGMGVTVVFWLTFVLLIWGICWTLALLWAVTLYLRRPGWGSWVFAAFSVHALLLTAYPQHIIWQGYLVAGYVGVSLVRGGGGFAPSAKRAAMLAGAALVGVVSVAPVYLDLLMTTQRSARLHADASFFLAALPTLHGARDLAVYLLQVVDPFWLGNPIRDAYPTSFDGVCLSPMVAGLLLLSFTGGWPRRVWPAHLFVVGTLAMTLSPALFRIGVEFFGLRVSRFDPLAAALIPAAVLAAWAADQVIRRGVGNRGVAIASVGAPLMIAAIGAAVSPHPIDGANAAMGVSLGVGTAAFVWLRSPALLVIVATVGTFHYALPQQLLRTPGEIHLDSPLVQTVRLATQGRSRFALVGENIRSLLPPNQEGLLGLRSIHSYNSLSARLYQSWVSEVSDRGTAVLGRHFRAISNPDRLGGPEFSYAGVGALLSARELTPPLVGDRLLAAGDGGVYRVARPPLLDAQLVAFRDLDGQSATIDGVLHDAPRLESHRSLDRDDHLVFTLTAAPEPTLLFVSQQYHPDWVASAVGREIPTAIVNGFFQGVFVPAGTSQVDLRFRPLATLSWLPQLLFAAAVLGGMIHWTLARHRGGGRGASGS
ncbi:hypothetical protein MK489_17815 [Myxococcota bacterium]|nr:hypothetical protein [Myxococcota bacterium]